MYNTQNKTQSYILRYEAHYHSRSVGFSRWLANGSFEMGMNTLTKEQGLFSNKLWKRA